MRVVDTSIWIEWLIDSPLKQAVAKEFPEAPHCIVPTIVQLELYKWLLREMGEAEADQVISFTQTCVVVTLDTKIALQAAELHRQYKLATAELTNSADLITCDAHFEGLPDVLLIRKS